MTKYKGRERGGKDASNSRNCTGKGTRMQGGFGARRQTYTCGSLMLNGKNQHNTVKLLSSNEMFLI